MALADSVPGVSGGTGAFIMGFYERFLGALHGLGIREERKDALRYLRKWGAGWLLGFCASVLFLAQMLETHIYLMSSLFIGLTAASFPVLIREEKESLRNFSGGLPFLIAGTALVWGMAVLQEEGGMAGHFDYGNLTAGQYGLLFLSGILAVSAMLLPGISGSTLLLMVRVDPLSVSSLDDLRSQVLSDMKGGELDDALAAGGAELAHDLDSSAMNKLPAKKIVNNSANS